ncbi:Asp-tRNA(Asn)/Glu-tRNA(Gln) amidotransferase subunit GatB [Mycoplasma struthionis]|uniref:Aspartyl/glutamyl-tRNA(Asn/Gln) amidotransferase subunit B n=1 Tax=Mycoplasma struthionis TaxID=538220 RepID=A0A3G8LIF8_9MOLU|nr:Asp-tRNA(Asn)/Glu-tRNA(Gln) amidotransferase subunit GatB [Mycoplasma struthionis]AZG68672.1 Asp-tRNA(Asn)/Glu-tRNA(Gln) amidotransferase subunit GatB [Mycoplasma struthionis]
MNKDWEIIIGIEIHIELNTKTKMFSPVANDFNLQANEAVSNIDLAYPGSLPLVNKEAIIKGIKLAKALNMTIDKLIRFDRKNYFYPDLTKGYQITQQFNPIGSNGTIEIKLDNEWKDISIQRIHLEEDTAKSLHEGPYTYLNYNRAGVPLIEIVSDPVMRSAKEAVAYVDAIRKTALLLNISDAKMNEGSLRTDVNISVRKLGSDVYNTRVEIKNLNSLSNVEKAIEYEANWQIQKYLNNETFEQETKRFDESSQTTVSMRSKSSAIDYKYYPEPNIPAISLSDELINSVTISETPYEKEMRYKSLDLNDVQISQLVNNIEYANYLDSIKVDNFKKAANIFFSDLVSYLNLNSKNITELKFDNKDFETLLSLLFKNEIDKKNIHKIIELKETNSSKNLLDLIKENNLYLEKNEKSLEEVFEDILKENPSLEAEFSKNYDRASKFALGQCMKKTMGKANAKELNELIAKRFPR